MSRSLPPACALLLAPVLLAAGGGVGSVAGSAVEEAGTPATFAWGDADGDGKLELAAVSADGALQLLASAGEDRFEDVSERVGLAGIADAALALWVDYDADGRLDLFVGARAGASRLFRNEGGLFVDMTAGVGLVTEGAVKSADWLDHDGDGRADLHVVTAQRHELYRGLEGGFFERAEMPSVGGSSVGESGAIVVADARPASPPAPERSSDGSGSTTGAVRPGVVDGGRPSGDRVPLGPSPSFGGATPIVSLPGGGCAATLKDQADPGTCLVASSTPALGKLYPLSSNLFVAVGGNVGIGTTSPSAKLHVAGTARVTDTLTLAPSGDQALNVSTGSIYKGGTLFIHTKGSGGNAAIGRGALASVTMALNNTACGERALFSTTIGFGNTAVGKEALYSNNTGGENTASGSEALRGNTTGSNNTASGSMALFTNTTGYRNTADGGRALFFNTTGHGNTASGYVALFSNTTGYHNTASGYSALSGNTTGFQNTAIGVNALLYNTGGSLNVASGNRALSKNTTGSFNTATGAGALYGNLTGASNTAIGYGALYFNTTGSRNIGLGKYGGVLSTGNDNIAIGNEGAVGENGTIRIGTAGTHTRAFVAGIRGVTTANANAIPVLVDSDGQLGTVSSSARFKKDIADMGDRTEKLLELRPVVFRYLQEQKLPDGSAVPLEYGLIAEEVAEVFPDLVVYDEDGKPFTVKYHLLSAMLLNELQRMHVKDVEQAMEFERHQARELLEQRLELTRLRGFEARLDALESQTAASRR